MKTIPTKNGELLCVEVPMDAKDFKIMKPNYGADYDYGHIPFYIFANGIFNTPIVRDMLDEYYDWEIIGTITNGVLDFDAEPYVERNPSAESYEFGAVYMDYRNYDYELVARDSFLSLLISYNVEYSGKKIAILSKK